VSTLPKHDLAPGPLDACQVCGAKDLELVLDLGHQAPCDSLLWPDHLRRPESTFPLRFLRCPECTLAQIDYVVPPEVLFYPEYPYRSGITPTLTRNLRATAFTAVERFKIPAGALAMDIGSNDGTLLSGFKDKGLRVLGVEPTNIARIANDRGIPTLQRFFSEDAAREIAQEHGHASVVTAANMFAHVAGLGGLIRGVEHLLTADGVFITESHYLLDILETVQYDSIYHEHLKYYSVRSLIRLFEPYDFTVVDAERIENYGGSIRVYAVKGKNRPVADSLKGLLAEEERRGAYSPATFAEFARKVRRSKRDLQSLAVQAAARGERVVGVGCPGRCSTLLNYCGIDVDLMPYIAEQSTSLKLGLALPGKHIPIVDEEVLFREPPAYAVILSWHYYRPIVAKLREKGLRAKIVLPLPEVRILEND
jgi:C-methyltransferase-like protein/putative zinc binding protein/methyltransferase family protein